MVRPRATWPGPPLRQEELRCGGSAESPQDLEHRPGLAADNCPSRKPRAHSVVFEETTGKLCGPVAVTKPNDSWSVDFKGQFRTGDGKYLYPLTVTDNHSR